LPPPTSLFPTAGSPLLDLPEPLLFHILGFFADAWSRHRAALACHRLLVAERATRATLWLRGDPRSDPFLFLRPTFWFPPLERLDLSLVSPWGHQFLSSAAPSSSDAIAPSVTAEEATERNAFIAAHFAYCFPIVSSLAVYRRDPTTLASLTPHWRSGLRSVKLVCWHQRPPCLDASADLEPLRGGCPALRPLDAFLAREAGLTRDVVALFFVML